MKKPLETTGLKIMDTSTLLEVQGLEFIALTEITHKELLGYYSRARIVVEIANGFGIFVTAAQNSNKYLKWVTTQIAAA
jgi:hypothetical protein